MKKRYFILILLTLLSVITYLDRLCIAVAGPSMQQDLGLSPEQWGWVMGVFALTSDSTPSSIPLSARHVPLRLWKASGLS